MTVRTVTGTAIQAAIDASAASGDEIWVNNVGGYKGYDVPSTKNILIRASNSPFRTEAPANPAGNGNVVQMKGKSKAIGLEASGAFGQHGSAISITGPDATLEDCRTHDTERGYGVRVYGAAAVRPRIIRHEASHSALGIFIDGGGADGIVDQPYIHHIDRMLVNDPTAGNDTGGQAMGFKRNNGLVTVLNPNITKAYSVKKTTGPDAGEPASNDYGWDGAIFELYESNAVLVLGGQVGGSPIIVETGRGAGGADCRDFTMKGTKIVGEWPGAIPADPNQPTLIRSNKGMLLRSAVNFAFEDLDISQLDYWIFSLAAGSGYDGTVSGLRILNNVARLKQGTRWMSWMAGIPLTAIAPGGMNGNQVFFSGPGSVVAEVFHPGKGQTNDRGVFQNWTGHEISSYWGPEVVAPPVDPCATITAERDALIASLDTVLGQLAVANSQAGASAAKVAQAKAIGEQISSLNVQINSLTIQLASL